VVRQAGSHRGVTRRRGSHSEGVTCWRHRCGLPRRLGSPRRCGRPLVGRVRESRTYPADQRRRRRLSRGGATHPERSERVDSRPAAGATSMTSRRSSG
jgi:hypothetical protein